MTEITAIKLARHRVDSAAFWLNQALQDMERAFEGNTLRPTALDRPELRRRLRAVSERIGED